MSDVLESWMVLHSWRWLLLLLHHLVRVVVRCTSRVCDILFPALVVLVVVSATLVREVLGTFVFVRTAILCAQSVYGLASVSCMPKKGVQVSRDTYILESRDGVVDVAGGVLVEFFVVTEDDNGDVDGAEYG